jgi:hypothetical protein
MRSMASSASPGKRPDADALATAIRTLDAAPLQGVRRPRSFADHVDEVRILLREVATCTTVVTPSKEGA